MGISLAPQADEQPQDPLKPKPVSKPLAASPTSAPAPAIGLAPAPQAPGKAGGIPAMTAPAMTAPTPTVAPPSAPVDRQAVAQGTFDNLAAQRQAKYNTESRDNIRTSAALGQIASGGLRTREGDLRLARDRDLDLLQRDLALKAAEGSIADATTAYQQGLAGAQQGLAEKIGLAGIENQKGSLDLQKDSLDLNAELGRGGLALEKEKFQTGAGQTQQQIDLAKKAQEIETQFKAGSLTLAQRDQALRELQNQQSFGLEKEKIALAAGAQEIANQVALGQLSIAQATAALDEKVRLGQLTLAERNAALQELAQSQQNAIQSGQLGLATKAQADTQANEQQRIQLAKEQLAQQGAQFGLSLGQQKELATLADKTANRQLDISSAQGQNSLLLELARIMGSKDLASIPPEFLASIAKALGIALSAKDPTKIVDPVVGITSDRPRDDMDDSQITDDPKYTGYN